MSWITPWEERPGPALPPPQATVTSAREIPPAVGGSACGRGRSLLRAAATTWPEGGITCFARAREQPDQVRDPRTRRPADPPRLHRGAGPPGGQIGRAHV